MRIKTIYELTIEDIQNVASETIGRKLNFEEISIIKDFIAEKINWFDAIESAIIEVVGEN